MTLERIERALREGPVDEPAYVPGAFRRPRRTGWSRAVVSTLVGAALVTGLIVGIGLGALRQSTETVGTAPDPEKLDTELQGTWVSDAISRDDWVSRLVAMGHHIDDVENFLLHDPMTENVTYFLTFERGTLTITSSLDGAPVIHNSLGPYRIAADGTLTWDDLGCFVRAGVRLDGDRLTFDALDTESCGADERVANSAFFNLAAYTRSR